MEVADVDAKSVLALARITVELPDVVLVVDRTTGELVDVLGDKLETSNSIARAIATVTATLSSLESAVGGRLLKLEVEYSTCYAVAQIDGSVIKVSMRSW